MSVCVLHFCKKCLKGFLFLNYLSSFLPMQDFNKSWNIYYTQTFFCILFYIWKSEMDHKLVFFIALNDVLLSLFCFVLFLHKEMHLPCQDFILSTSTAFLKGWVWIKGKKKKTKGGRERRGGNGARFLGLYIAVQSTLRVLLLVELGWTSDSISFL